MMVGVIVVLIDDGEKGGNKVDDSIKWLEIF